MRIILAVSGGIDSMYMSERASELFPEASLAMAHCNFALRGKESDGDEEFVRSWCREHGMPLHVRRFDTRAVAQEQGISIEMAARDLRYAWFAELCREYGYDAVAVAHNADDNAETLVLNLVRGTGSRGMRGMSERSVMDGVAILRPMLGITREQIRLWMTGHGKKWREDSTNAGIDYKRNKIRNQVFPLLRELNPSVIRTLGEDMARLAQVDDIAEDYFRGCGLDPDCIDIQALKGHMHWEYLLFRLTEGRISADALDALTEAIRSGRSIAGRSFGQYVAGDGMLLHGEAQKPLWSWEIVPRDECPSLRQPKGILLLDADRLGAEPQPRHWQDGDWMIPLGMKGRKKLSDMFTDLRYPIPRKKAALLLPHPDGQGRIAALIGERIDESMKVTDSTERVLIIRCQK